MKRILITGASGMIGRMVLQNLTTSDDFEVYAASSGKEKIRAKVGKLTVIKNDEVEDLLRQVEIDVLLQLAFPRNVEPEQWADGIEYAIKLLFLAQKYAVKKVVNVSSQSIYGLQRKEAADEQHEIYLVSPYTTGKFCTEIVGNQLFSKGDYTNIRLSTTIAPSTRERVPNKLLAQIVSGSDLIIEGGKQQFSFLDVRDAADGLECLLRNSGRPWKPVYNLGTSEVHSLMDIARLCEDVAERNTAKRTEIILRKDIDSVMANQLDVSLFGQEFLWKAKRSLEESLDYIFKINYM